MSRNTAIIIPLAYPDTVVMVSSEWYLQHLYCLGIGKKNYVKAGHAALLLIELKTGLIEYFDFGRYITPSPFGRVRSALTDNELTIPLKAKFKNDSLLNRDAIFKFFATHPELTHGDGNLIVSVCENIDYTKAKRFLAQMQASYLIEYAAFKKEASNCARFVTDTLIASVNDKAILKKLKKIKRFTPSPIGNILAVKGGGDAYKVSGNGEISVYNVSKSKEIVRCFANPLRQHQSSVLGTLQPKNISDLSKNAQWLPGIGAGAWFELFQTTTKNQYRFRRTSANGTVDIDAIFYTEDTGFDLENDFVFDYKSHCNELNIHQNKNKYTFYRLSSLVRKVHLV